MLIKDHVTSEWTFCGFKSISVSFGLLYLLPVKRLGSVRNQNFYSGRMHQIDEVTVKDIF